MRNHHHITDPQLLHLFELCSDAEQRCSERLEKAQRDGDHDAAFYEAQMGERYRLLRGRIFQGLSIEGRPTMMDEVVKQLHDLGQLWRTRSGSTG